MNRSIKHLYYIAICLFVFPLVSFSVFANSQTTKPSIVFVSENKIWQMSSDDMQPEALALNISDHSEMHLGDVTISKDGNFIYYVVHSASISTLFRYGMTAKDTRTLFAHENLSRITSSSLDGKRLLIYLADMKNPINTKPCLLDIEQQTCRVISIDVDFNEFYWLNNTDFLTIVFNKMSVYSFTGAQELQLIENDRVTDRDTDVAIPAMSSDGKTILLLTYPASDMYRPSFFAFDTQTHVITRLSHLKIAQNDAVVHSMRMSPDGQRLAYSKATTLTIIDMMTGETIIEEPDILDFMWIANERMLVSSANKPFTLSTIDITQNTKTDLGVFSSEIHFIKPPM